MTTAQAYNLIEEMKSKIANVNVAYYINLDTVRAIEQSLGVQLIGEQFPSFPSTPTRSARGPWWRGRRGGNSRRDRQIQLSKYFMCDAKNQIKIDV